MRELRSPRSQAREPLHVAFGERLREAKSRRSAQSQASILPPARIVGTHEVRHATTRRNRFVAERSLDDGSARSHIWCTSQGPVPCVGCHDDAGTMKFAAVFSWLFVSASACACGATTAADVQREIGGCGLPSGGSCTEERYYLSCRSANGSQAFCVSNASDACSDAPNASYTCKSQCTSSEYGAACGSASQPPAGCRSASAPNPAGTFFYCCPCSE